MTRPPAQLPARVAAVTESAQRLVDAVPGVVAVGLAGSWARGTGGRDSDVDLVVLTTDAPALVDSTQWFVVFDGEAELVRWQDFGAVQERRLRLSDGLEVEVGIGAPSWACTEPVDAGTWRVVSDGFAALYDPDRLLAELIKAVESR